MQEFTPVNFLLLFVVPISFSNLTLSSTLKLYLLIVEDQTYEINRWVTNWYCKTLPGQLASNKYLKNCSAVVYAISPWKCWFAFQLIFQVLRFRYSEIVICIGWSNSPLQDVRFLSNILFKYWDYIVKKKCGMYRFIVVKILTSLRRTILWQQFSHYINYISRKSN